MKVIFRMINLKEKEYFCTKMEINIVGSFLKIKSMVLVLLFGKMGILLLRNGKMGILLLVKRIFILVVVVLNIAF